MPAEIIIDPASLDQNKTMTHISDNCERNGNCLIWIKCTNSSGYPQMKIKFLDGSRKLTLVHRIVYAVSHNVILGQASEQKMQVSHLCHESRCVSIDHLVLEPSAINNDRRSCFLHGFCHKLHSSVGIQYPNCIFG
jgi:hypothetical protein